MRNYLDATGERQENWHEPLSDNFPGSRLYHLAPYGMGSGQCEGLISYICRLSRAHCVNPRRLIKFVFAEIDPSIAKLHCNSFYVTYIGTANGLGEYAERLSHDANLLTGHTDLTLLTFLPWKDLIPANCEKLISKCPRWCAHCFAEQLTDLGETYCPLAWSLQPYRNCAKHKCALCDRCPRCGRQQAHIPKTPDGVFCCRCRASLLPAHFSTEQMSTNLDTERAIELMIAHNGEAVASATHKNFVHSLQLLLTETVGGNRAAFCKVMGWDAWALNGWMKKGKKVTLAKLLEIVLRFNLSPVDLCSGALADLDAQTIAPRWNSGDYWHSRAKKPQLTATQCEVVRERLQAILQSTAAPEPLSHIAATNRLTRGGLKYLFPELCGEISTRRKLMRADKLALARIEREEIVSHAVADILAVGGIPSRRGVDAAIRNFGLALARPDVFRAYQAAVRTSNGLHIANSTDDAVHYIDLEPDCSLDITRHVMEQISK